MSTYWPEKIGMLGKSPEAQRKHVSGLGLAARA